MAADLPPHVLLTAQWVLGIGLAVTLAEAAWFVIRRYRRWRRWNYVPSGPLMTDDDTHPVPVERPVPDSFMPVTETVSFPVIRNEPVVAEPWAAHGWSEIGTTTDAEPEPGPGFWMDDISVDDTSYLGPAESPSWASVNCWGGLNVSQLAAQIEIASELAR
jgi:hypothetical protein